MGADPKTVKSAYSSQAFGQTSMLPGSICHESAPRIEASRLNSLVWALRTERAGIRHGEFVPRSQTSASRGTWEIFGTW